MHFNYPPRSLCKKIRDTELLLCYPLHTGSRQWELEVCQGCLPTLCTGKLIYSKLFIYPKKTSFHSLPSTSLCLLSLNITDPLGQYLFWANYILLSLVYKANKIYWTPFKESALLSLFDSILQTPTIRGLFGNQIKN